VTESGVMPTADLTCWTMIREAAAGDPAARDRFARVYQPIVAAYLAARWHRRDADDAVQDVFVECFRDRGALASADPTRGFRAFLLGVVRNVARRHEATRKSPAALPPGLPADDTGPAQAFDRAWARALMREAAHAQEEAATTEPAVRRVQLLRMRFQDGLPIRDIATRWKVDAARLHHEYATARQEFRLALRKVVAFHNPAASAADVERECLDLLAALGN